MTTAINHRDVNSAASGQGGSSSAPGHRAVDAVASDARGSSGFVPAAAAGVTGRLAPWTGRQHVATTGAAPALHAPLDAPVHRSPRRGSAALMRRARAWRADVIFTIFALEGGAALGLGLAAQPWSDWASPASMITALSRVTAMGGTALALLAILLSARIPWIERSVGQDRLIAWHRTIGPYSLYLIAAHVLLVTIGYAMADKLSFWSEWWSVVLTMEWMLPALLGFVLLSMIGVTSWRRARNRMRYETWWVIHVYAYLGVALSFMHQIVDGTMFTSDMLLRNAWIIFTASTFVIIVWFRGVVPIISSLYHGFTVERVDVVNHNTVSIIISGRRLDELQAHGGQFFGFRFLTRRYWWESHPYSISAAPRNGRLRVTVKDLGDHSKWMATLQPGTRVWLEGPYGVFMANQVTGDAVTLIGAGVGITPVRALLEELPRGTRIDILWRASDEQDLMLRDEMEALAQWHGARIHYLVGSRRHVNFDVRTIRDRVPHITQTEVFICGPEPVVEQAVSSLHAIGVPKQQIHAEAFAY